MSIRLSPEQVVHVALRADETGLSATAFVRHLIEQDRRASERGDEPAVRRRPRGMTRLADIETGPRKETP
jgi:hypothetical protein